jgi:hypothetical protein
MWQKTLEFFENYCIVLLSSMLGFIEKAHGVIAMGVPLLLIVAAHFLLPRWAGVALAVLVVIPAAVGMGMVVITGLSNTRRP